MNFILMVIHNDIEQGERNPMPIGRSRTLAFEAIASNRLLVRAPSCFFSIMLLYSAAGVEA